ncbi:MAG: hypothetical protein ACXAC7_21390 [Candidatus Hodarchaeales archaeon]|jgi:hypothetical protein
MSNSIIPQEQQRIPASQIRYLDEPTKLKIAFEEWISSEFESLARQHEDAELLNTRFIAVDALLSRSNQSSGAVWYEITPENEIWVLFTQAIIHKLDQNLLYLFIKLVLETLHVYRKSKDDLTIKEAEILAYNAYLEDMKRIHSNKAIKIAERLKQVLYLLTVQYYRQGLPILDPRTRIPPSDKIIQKQLKSSFSRIRQRVFTYVEQQSIGVLKFRAIPYIFQDIGTETQLIQESGALRIKPAHSLLVRDSTGRYTLAIILISTFFIEAILNEDEVLDYVISYEIFSILGSIKYQRGGMEQEIFNIMSKDRDSAEESLYSHYSRKNVVDSKKRTDTVLFSLLEKNVPILKVYE